MAFSTILLFSLVAASGATPCATDGHIMSDACRDEDVASSFLQHNSLATRGGMLEQEKSNRTVTSVPKFDCMKYTMPIQVLKDGKKGFAFKTLDVESGEYSSLFSIPFKTTFPAYKDLNGCGINPVDSIAYCTLWSASKKNFVVRVHKDTVEFVAEVPVEKFFNTGCFSEDGTYFIADEKARFLIIENVAQYKGLRSERNPSLPKWSSMKAVQPKGFHSAYDAVMAKANIEGTKQPKEYLIVLSKGSLLIAKYEKGTFSDTWDVPYMTGNKKDGWKKGKASDKWGAGWYFSGKIFFAANDGAGVYQVDLSKLDLSKHGKGKGKEAFKMRLAGKSDKSGFNDGTNCLKAADPWLTSILPFNCEKHGTPLQAIRQDWMGYAIKKLDMTSGAYQDVYSLPFTKTDPPYKFLNAIGMNPLDTIPYGCMLFKDFPAKFWLVRFDGTKFEYVVKVKDEFDPVAGTFNSEGEYFFVHNTNFSHNIVMFNLGKVHDLRGFPDKNAKGIKQLNDLRSGIVHSLPLYNFFHFADIVSIKAAIEDKTTKEYIVAVNLERQAMFVEWDETNSTNSKIYKFGTNDPWAADGGKAYLAFGAAWHYDDRAFFANNDGFGVVEITDLNVENQTLTLEKVGKSTRVYNNDGFNCWNMANPFGAPPKGIRPILSPLVKLAK